MKFPKTYFHVLEKENSLHERKRRANIFWRLLAPAEKFKVPLIASCSLEAWQASLRANPSCPMLKHFDLQTTFRSRRGRSVGVNVANFHLNCRELLWGVGECGPGKSTTMLSFRRRLLKSFQERREPQSAVAPPSRDAKGSRCGSRVRRPGPMRGLWSACTASSAGI